MRDDDFAGTARIEYFDHKFQTQALKLLPGEYQVAPADTMLVTVVGSCVAACIRDTRLGIGGMNHFMLPDGGAADGPGSESARYGVYAMEVLVGKLLKLGVDREHLEAKVFGGGTLLETAKRSVGERNAAFVLRFLRGQGIRIAAQDLLGVHPRKIYFFPDTGRTLVKTLRALHNDTIVQRERDYRARLLGESSAARVDAPG
ncbi:MAG: chemoreceptor glutamine deamidase CheD [Casimicrobiaceae bacterium]